MTYINNDKPSDLEFEHHAIDCINKVTNRLELANEVERLKTGLSLVIVWFFVLLLLVRVFVIFNTVKLDVHSRRAELDILRYRGGT